MTEDTPRVIKVDRPRDEFGRPLPAGSENRLHLEEFETLPLETVHRLAIQYFDAGQYFGAHEAWETTWRQTRGTEDEEFFKGLSQLGAGYTHYRRGNPHGAQVLLRRGLGRIRPYGPRHHGIDVEGLWRAAEEHAGRFERVEREGGALPDIEPPHV